MKKSEKGRRESKKLSCGEPCDRVARVHVVEIVKDL
jgi:hypothetical protein